MRIFRVIPIIKLLLSVLLQLDKRDYPQNLHVVFCPNKYPVLECKHSFLFLFLFFNADIGHRV